MSLPPRLNHRFAVLASRDGDASLLATLLAGLSEPQTYTPTFLLPRLEYPKSSVTGDTGDEFFSNLIGIGYADRLGNLLATLRCELVVILGLSANQLSYLEFLSSAIAIEPTDGGVATFLRDFGRPKSAVEARHDQAELGIFAAATMDSALRVSAQAVTLPKFISGRNRALVLLETQGSCVDIVVASYAAAAAADFALLANVSEEELSSIRDLLDQHSGHEPGALERAKALLANRLQGLDLKSYDEITFFTCGLPYGLALEHEPVCSYVPIRIQPELMITASVMQATMPRPRRFGSAIVFCPELDLGTAAQREVATTKTSLGNHRFSVMPLIGRSATLRSLNLHGTHSPYDLLHLCSHGGKADGYYVRQEFTDRAGALHVIEYDEVVGFAPSRGEMVEVFSKAIFRRFDGYRWRSPELRARGLPDYVFKDMGAALRSGRETGLTRVPLVGKVEGSCHIQCVDSIHQGEFQSMASQSLPLGSTPSPLYL